MDQSLTVIGGVYFQVGFDIVCRAGILGDNGTNTITELYDSNFLFSVVNLSFHSNTYLCRALNGFPFGELGDPYGLTWALQFPNLVSLFFNRTNIHTDFIPNGTFSLGLRRLYVLRLIWKSYCYQEN